MRMEWPCAGAIVMALAIGAWTAMVERPIVVEASTAEQQPGKGIRGAAAKTAGQEAREEEKDKDSEKGIRGAAARTRDGRIVFTERERVLIRDWFRTNRRGLPPGLAKRDRLPPGLEKQLRERGTLPPGLEKRMHPLPIELDRRLPRLPERHRRIVLGGHVIVMSDDTGMIHDIIRDVVR